MDVYNFIILGNNDDITLDIIQILGSNNILSSLIVVYPFNINYTCKSKYVIKYYSIFSHETALLLLQTQFDKDNKKKIVILTNDDIINELDRSILKNNPNYMFLNYKNYLEELYKYGIKLNNKILIKEKKIIMYKNLNCILKKMKLEKLFYALTRIYYTDIEQQILEANAIDVLSCEKNLQFKVVELNKNNLKNICTNKIEEKIFYKMFKNGNINGVAIFDNDILVGKAFIKMKNCNDRVFNIKNSNSYVITNMHINKEYQGNHLQQNLIFELTNRFVKDIDSSRIYAYVYNYNIPSLKNFLSTKFKVINKINIKRFLLHSINKITI